MYPMRASCTQVVDTLANDVLEADRVGLRWRSIHGSGAHHRLGLFAEVVRRNRIRWSAAQLSNESVFPHTTNSTP